MKDDNARQGPAEQPPESKPTGAAEARKPQAEAATDAQQGTQSNLNNNDGDRSPTMSPYEFVSLIFAGLTFVAASVAATVYYYQLREMRHSTDAAVSMAETAKESASIAAKTLEESTKAMKIDQRAWIGIDVIKMQDLVAGGPLFTSVRYKNMGKTFALNSRTKSSLQIRKTPLTSADEITSNKETYKFGAAVGTLYPGANNFIPLPGGPPVLVDQSVIDQIKSGELLVYIAGEIHYDDIFGDHHITRFFEKYIPQANAYQVEGTHNDAD